MQFILKSLCTLSFLFILITNTITEDIVESWYGCYQQQDGKKIGYVYHRIEKTAQGFHQQENVYLFRLPQNKYMPFLEITEYMNPDMTIKSRHYVQYRGGKKTVKEALVKDSTLFYKKDGQLRKEIKITSEKLYGNFGGRNIKLIAKDFKVGNSGQAHVAQDEEIVTIRFHVHSTEKIKDTLCYRIDFSRNNGQFTGSTYAHHESGHDIVYKMKDPYLIWKKTTKEQALALP